MSYLPTWQIKTLRFGVLALGLFLLITTGVLIGYRPDYEIIFETNSPRTYCERDRLTMVTRQLSNYLDMNCTHSARCSACWSHHAIQFANSGTHNQPVAIHLASVPEDRWLSQPIVRSAYLADQPVQSVYSREYSLQDTRGRLLIHDVPPGDEVVVQILLSEPGRTENPSRAILSVDAPFGRVTEGDPGLTLIGRMLWSVVGVDPTPIRGRRVLTLLAEESSHWVAEDFE